MCQALLGHKRLNTTLTYARVHDQTVADDYYTAMAVIEERMQFPLRLPPEQNPGSNGDSQSANGNTAHLLLLLDTLQAEPLTESQQALATELQRGLATLIESLNGGHKQVDQTVNERAADSLEPIPLP